jgi:hypothetical protein
MPPSDSLASFGHGFGSPRQWPTAYRRGKGLPGYWDILFMRAVVQHPAGCDPSSPLLLFEKIYAEVAFAFAHNRTLDIRNDIAFEAKNPRPTRSRAYASPASLPKTVARLATGSDGLTPGRAGFAPAG